LSATPYYTGSELGRRKVEIVRSESA